MNERVTPKDRNAIKGALRRAFSRSELHKRVLYASIVDYVDESRPRVKTWCRCNICKKPEARSYMVVDHIDPLVPVNTTFADMNLETIIDRLWCAENNLQTVCPSCHDKKTKTEKEQRKQSKKEKK